IARNYGIDPYHLGITFLVNLEIAYLAPPLGLNLMISSFRFNTPVADLYKSVLPFIGVLTVTLLITTYVPWLSTYLPSLSKTKDLTEQEMGLPAQDAEGGELNLDSLDKAAPDKGGDTLDSLDDLNLDDLGGPKPDAAPAPAAPTPEGAAPAPA